MQTTGHPSSPLSMVKVREFIGQRVRLNKPTSWIMIGHHNKADPFDSAKSTLPVGAEGVILTYEVRGQHYTAIHFDGYPFEAGGYHCMITDQTLDLLTIV